MHSLLRTVHRHCPLCNKDNTNAKVHRYSDPEWRLISCPVCNFIYVENAPMYEQLSSAMAWEKTSKAEDIRRAASRGRGYNLSKKTRWRLHLFPRKKITALITRHISPGNIIDLGCGTGGHMLEMGNNYIPYGIEVSRTLYEMANTAFRQLGGRVVHAPCLVGLQEFPDNYFSGATLRSYLEHEARPAEVLKELHRTLQPGGVALVKVPNYATLNRLVMGKNWCGFRFPDHLNYFTPNTLRAMAISTGYKVYYGLTYKLPTNDNMYAVLTKPASPSPGSR